MTPATTPLVFQLQTNVLGVWHRKQSFSFSEEAVHAKQNLSGHAEAAQDLCSHLRGNPSRVVDHQAIAAIDVALVQAGGIKRIRNEAAKWHIRPI